jgi:hypothetical protein
MSSSAWMRPWSVRSPWRPVSGVPIRWAPIESSTLAASTGVNEWALASSGGRAPRLHNPSQRRGAEPWHGLSHAALRSRGRPVRLPVAPSGRGESRGASRIWAAPARRNGRRVPWNAITGQEDADQFDGIVGEAALCSRERRGRVVTWSVPGARPDLRSIPFLSA